MEKHLHDRTLQPLSEFKKIGEKEEGCHSGFQAEHEYNEHDKAIFMVKSALNRTLTEEDKQSKLAQLKASFYEGSRKAAKLFPIFLAKFEVVDKIGKQHMLR